MMKDLQTYYGRLMMNNLLSYIWLGDWDGYESAMKEIPSNLLKAFPFHKYYDRDEVALWYDNHFTIPGDYFVSPYLSAYSHEPQDMENVKKDLLCLIGIYEKVGFYYPIERELYPDHIGSLSSFLVATIKEEIRALEENDDNLYDELKQLEMEVIETYLFPFLMALQQQANKKILLTFFREFIQFYINMLKRDWEETKQAADLN